MRPGYAVRARRSTARSVNRDPARHGVGDLVEHFAACATRSYLHVEPVIGGLHDVQGRARAEPGDHRAEPAQPGELIAIALDEQQRPARRGEVLGALDTGPV